MRRYTGIILAALVAFFYGAAQGFASTSLRTPRLGTKLKLSASIDNKHNGGDSFATDFSASVSSTEPPLGRAVEILSIVAGQILSPLVASILHDGFPSDWDRFWSQGGTITNGQRIALAAEKLGPTYVKFGQALASRPDVIPKSLASALETLQDDMQPFDTETARSIISSELETCMEPYDLELFLKSLGEEPVGAASIGQVYKGYLPGFGAVAVKVKRRGIRELVERDAVLLRSLAEWIESIPAIPASGSNRLIATELVKAVEEFFCRIFEELDYRREAANCAEFAAIYATDNRRVNTFKVVVPEILPQFCTDNVLVMEWLEGTKLTDVDVNDLATVRENLEIISIGISCTLSQLLETGVSNTRES
jgi:predicted unusual protein kinase regulating ubiquinone biosynthesis (AarF/ABC1/UbiB family)